MLEIDGGESRRIRFRERERERELTRLIKSELHSTSVYTHGEDFKGFLYSVQA